MPSAATKFHFLQRLHENGPGTDPERGRGHTVNEILLTYRVVADAGLRTAKFVEESSH
jgi:hypothetical protein